MIGAAGRFVRAWPKRIPATLIALLAAGAMGAAASGEVEREMLLGTNYWGNDIATIALDKPDPAECRRACDRDGQCKGWSFVKPGTLQAKAVCALKSRIDNPGFDQNVISAPRTGMSYPMPVEGRIDNTMAMGADLPGGDIANGLLDRGDPSLCAAACGANGACQAWTFMKPGIWNAKAICWLKGAVATPVPNANTISGRRPANAPPPPPPATTDWGVWATAVGGAWNDPCAIQYAAAAIAGNRYDADTRNYRRVRTRASQREADLDINAFSRFFQDKPDGTVKLTPCGGGGGPAVSGAIPPAGTGFGVWAYVVGVADRNDPCSWQYVAAAIPGNRYDNDTNYRRVRARFTMADASSDVTFFSAFMKDQPDGVVKLVSCADSRKAAGGQPPVAPPPAGDPAVKMIGTYDSSYGELVLSAGGGTYPNPPGSTVIFTKVDGNVLEGIWRQPTGGGACADGQHHGRFRFTFDSGGFSGVWGYCEGELTSRWSGRRK